MNQENRHKSVPEWQLERFLLEELPTAEMSRIRERLVDDPELGRRLEVLRADSANTRERYPAAWMARQIEHRANRAAPAGRASISLEPVLRRLWPVPAAAGLAALLALVTLGGDDGDGGDGGDVSGRSAVPGIRLKGMEPQLVLHRKVDAGSEQLQDGSAARAGDLLQVQYHAAGRPFGAILSVDGHGSVTQHFPARGARAGALGSAGLTSLEFAYELDDAPRWERFYFVTAAAAFDLAAVVTAAGTAAASGDSLVLAAGLEQVILTLKKEPATTGRGGGA